MPTEPLPEPVPPPLWVGAVVAGLEGAVLVGYAVFELVAVSADRLVMGLTTAVFLAVYGVFLAFCALRLVRRESWARSPVVLAQLIQLGVAWGFWGGATVWVAVLLAVVAVVALVGVLHPASLAALDRPD